MGLAFGFAGLDALLYVAAVVLVSTRRRKGGPRALVDLSFTVACSAIDARARLTQRLAGLDRFRVERDDADALIFLQGLGRDEGQLLGISELQNVPRRALVRFTERPYHPTTIAVRLTEEITWLPALSPGLKATCHAALTRTAEQIAGALRD
jgi:hypothetical protein